MAGGEGRSEEKMMAAREALMQKWRKMENAFCKNIRALESYKSFFEVLLEPPASPILSQRDIAFVFFNVQDILDQHENLLFEIEKAAPQDSACSILTNFLQNVCVWLFEFSLSCKIVDTFLGI